MLKAKRYISYKPSNIDFIGDIPEHWEVKKLKFIVDKIMGGGTPLTSKSDYWTDNKDDGLLWVAIADITKSEYIENTKKYITEEGLNNSSAQRVEAYSVLYSIYASLGKVAYSQYELTTNQAILAIKPSEELLYKFLFYYLQTVEDKLPFLSSSTTQNNINLDVVKNFDITLPPYNEQERIVKFIDTKNKEIEEFIADKQEQIALLEEQKEAVINQAVTKGLDDSVKMKDSGIEWIGDIPKHWEAKKLKYCAKVVLGKMLCNTDKGNYQLKSYLKSKNIQWMKINTSSVEKMWFSEYEMSLYKLNKDDLVLSEGGEVGKTSLWNDEIEECYIQNSVHKVTVNNDNLPKYYLYLFFLYGKVDYFNSIVNKVSIAHLTKEKLENLECVVAPKDEQEQIIKYIEIELSKIDEVTIQIQQEIDLIQEYKISLISEVITGQIDVR